MLILSEQFLILVVLKKYIYNAVYGGTVPVSPEQVFLQKALASPNQSLSEIIRHQNTKILADPESCRFVSAYLRLREI